MNMKTDNYTDGNYEHNMKVDEHKDGLEIQSMHEWMS